MTQPHLTVALATATTMLAAMLILLRLSYAGRQPFLDLTQRWAVASHRTSCLILGLLAAIAALGFVYAGSNDLLVQTASPPAHVKRSASHDGSPDAETLDALRAYAGKIGPKLQSTAPKSQATEQAALPDVDSMIAKLVARLKDKPGDVKGWKMLGWSYLNMDRAEDAASAYETALKLDPADPEIKKALDHAKSMHQSVTQPAPSGP